MTPIQLPQRSGQERFLIVGATYSSGPDGPRETHTVMPIYPGETDIPYAELHSRPSYNSHDPDLHRGGIVYELPKDAEQSTVEKTFNTETRSETRGGRTVTVTLLPLERQYV